MLGREQSFAVNSVVQYGSRPENRHVARETWRCAAEARERVSLAAGSYDTIKIACEITAKDSSPTQTRVWYYAPRLKHYVRLVDFDETSTASRQIDLVAMQPTGLGWPPIVRDGLITALEHAVESSDADKPIVWESSAIEAKITIRPTDRYLDFDGLRCRRILQVLSKSGSHKTYPGLACRTPQGEWQVVGLHEGSPLMPAVAHR
jgi:hypothetical protein